MNRNYPMSASGCAPSATQVEGAPFVSSSLVAGAAPALHPFGFVMFWGQRRALRYQGRLYPVFPAANFAGVSSASLTMPAPRFTRYFGYRDFRAGQQFIVESVLQGRDALGVMPTGAGKSMCYQIPGIVMPGLALVVFSARVAYGRPGARSY